MFLQESKKAIWAVLGASEAKTDAFVHFRGSVMHFFSESVMHRPGERGGRPGILSRGPNARGAPNFSVFKNIRASEIYFFKK